MYKSSDSIFSGVKKQYYDADSGLRWGGIIGGLLGGLFGFQKYGLEGWIPAALTLMGVVIGTWFGNKAGSLIQGFRASKQPPAPDGLSLERAPEGQSRAQEPVVTPSTPTQKPGVHQTVTIR